MNFFFRLLIFLVFFTHQSFSNDNIIKIAISNNMIPYSFVDENNKPKGILVDYWNLWSFKTNQKIEFVPLSWSRTLEAVKNNKVDIHSGLFINETRSKYINFLKPIYKTTSKISGLKYKLVRDEWHVLLKDFENKKIDILPATDFIEQRSLYGLYTDKYMILKEFIYVDKKILILSL